MRDDHMGGLLAFLIAAPVVIICCAGGGVILAAILGGIYGWLTGLGGLTALLVAGIAALIWRSIRRSREAIQSASSRSLITEQKN
jgi:membrane protein implicated in regulation of membrane protease activity